MKTAEINRELVLDLWKAGASRQTILDRTKRRSGQRYDYIWIDKIVLAARKEKDPRAVYRRGPRA